MRIVNDILARLFCRVALPDRAGSHGVGTTNIKVTVAAEGGSSRRISAQIWYPIESSEPPARPGALARFLHPMWAPAHHGKPQPGSFGKAPLIVYVPDASGHHDDNTFTLANLASHGFVLASLSDPFRKENTAGGSKEIQRVERGIKTASLFVDALQQLQAAAPAGSWTASIDLAKLGIMGYAVGGVVAAEAKLADRRFIAAANLDGARRDDAAPVTGPYLLMLSDSSAATRNPVGDGSRLAAVLRAPARYRDAHRQAALPQSHVIELTGTKHEHFSDLLVLSSCRWFGMEQSSNWKRIRAIIDAYTVAFFRTYLRAAPQPLVSVRHSPYPEVRFVPAREPIRLHRRR
jgi:dienelactone hydrolase